MLNDVVFTLHVFGGCLHSLLVDPLHFPLPLLLPPPLCYSPGLSILEVHLTTQTPHFINMETHQHCTFIQTQNCTIILILLAILFDSDNLYRVMWACTETAETIEFLLKRLSHYHQQTRHHSTTHVFVLYLLLYSYTRI